MENYFTVGETAKIVKTTSETLRHYDRIGLVKPSRKEEWTGYRYYSKQDIVRLNTIRALRSMELSLGEIREVLEYDDLQKIVGFLERAERKADEKIAELQYCKAKIQLARKDYEKKRQGRQPVDGPFLQEFPERVILLSHTLEAPTLENLWDYLRHFYDQIDPAEREWYDFEDVAGIYTR
ncbi:MerR family transcriptional regulator, partial [Neglectibacter timonensis]